MNASCSMFSQILKLIPRIEFERMVRETGSEYAAKGLSSWSQFVAMMFCQLGRAHSLREIEGGLKSCEGKLAHLGIEAPARSSLSYANTHRPWQLYEQVFYRLFERVSGSIRPPKKFRFKHKLVSLDSTVIDLCLSVFDWARFRRTKGAVKLHLVLDHDGYLPCYGVITEGNVHDVKVAWRIPFPAGTVVVDDRGYNDYRLFAFTLADIIGMFDSQVWIDGRIGPTPDDREAWKLPADMFSQDTDQPMKIGHERKTEQAGLECPDMVQEGTNVAAVNTARGIVIALGILDPFGVIEGCHVPEVGDRYLVPFLFEDRRHGTNPETPLIEKSHKSDMGHPGFSVRTGEQSPIKIMFSADFPFSPFILGTDSGRVKRLDGSRG